MYVLAAENIEAAAAAAFQQAMLLVSDAGNSCAVGVSNRGL